MRFNLGENAKKYFNKFLKQTGVAVAVILVLYITQAALPGVWANIREPIHGTLERSIDFATIYNNSIGRLFPNAVIGGDDETDTNEPDTADTYNDYEDDYDFEVFRILDEDEILQIYIDDTEDEIHSL